MQLTGHAPNLSRQLPSLVPTTDDASPCGAAALPTHPVYQCKTVPHPSCPPRPPYGMQHWCFTPIKPYCGNAPATTAQAPSRPHAAARLAAQGVSAQPTGRPIHSTGNVRRSAFHTAVSMRLTATAHNPHHGPSTPPPRPAASSASCQWRLLRRRPPCRRPRGPRLLPRPPPHANGCCSAADPAADPPAAAAPADGSCCWWLPTWCECMSRSSSSTLCRRSRFACATLSSCPRTCGCGVIHRREWVWGNTHATRPLCAADPRRLAPPCPAARGPVHSARRSVQTHINIPRQRPSWCTPAYGNTNHVVKMPAPPLSPEPTPHDSMATFRSMALSFASSSLFSLSLTCSRSYGTGRYRVRQRGARTVRGVPRIQQTPRGNTRNRYRVGCWARSRGHYRCGISRNRMQDYKRYWGDTLGQVLRSVYLNLNAYDHPVEGSLWDVFP